MTVDDLLGALASLCLASLGGLVLCHLGTGVASWMFYGSWDPRPELRWLYREDD